MERFSRSGIGQRTPFGINAAFALFAVAGGLLLPQYLGTLAGRLLAMQFLVVHAIAMLYVFVWARSKAIDEGRDDDVKVCTVALRIMYVAYPVGALGVGGLFGLLEFVALAGGTFLGAWDQKHGRHELMQIGLRWAVAFTALIVATKVFGLPVNVDLWPGARGSVAAAALYFGVLATAEARPRFYRCLAARIWRVMRRARFHARSGGQSGD